jgi:hypothetical protein
MELVKGIEPSDSARKAPEFRIPFKRRSDISQLLRD